MTTKDTITVTKGQIWRILYGGEFVRMRVAGVSREGQVTLVEMGADGVAEGGQRMLATSTTGLVASGELERERERERERDLHVVDERTGVEVSDPANDVPFHERPTEIHGSTSTSAPETTQRMRKGRRTAASGLKSKAALPDVPPLRGEDE